MSKKRIFVSHSSKTDANITLLKKVCKGLEEYKTDEDNLEYQIVYDLNNTIIGGDDWYNSIERWMMEADAAVILFSKAALFDSDWVKKEVSNLSWRKNLDPDFVLIPVLLEGLEPNEFNKGLLGVLQINRIQFIKDTNDATEIVAELHKKLAAEASLKDLAERDFDGASYEPLEGKLAELIASKLPRDALDDAVKELDLTRPLWPPDKHKINALAVARHLVSNPDESMRCLSDFLDELQLSIPRECASNLIKYIKGMWVNREAAASLPNAKQTHKIIGLNGNKVENYTAKRYCERAWPLSSKWDLIRINETSFTENEIFSDIDYAITSSRETAKDKRIRNRIKRSRLAFIILIPGRIISNGTYDDLSEKLRKRYHGAIILVDIGPDRPPWLPETIEVLTPLIDTEEETNQFDDYQDTKTLFNNLFGTN